LKLKKLSQPKVRVLMTSNPKKPRPQAKPALIPLSPLRKKKKRDPLNPKKRLQQKRPERKKTKKPRRKQRLKRKQLPRWLLTTGTPRMRTLVVETHTCSSTVSFLSSVPKKNH